ncbi:MAG TPA: UDP-N-acetylglucosamine 1-carboxyvinyltransferase [Nitrospirae bacterium]|nr:UDP-N-acetylglucosamine 1-carboxyvinyltransferase [bacterium BMS3Abin06]HDH12271.1 UDP-N-acetylglucosamine 1-carboxyvinyltransferase [Nitrospirota bacterium]HDZ01147.1 UDP-N-acetylglucosamine 1-carboxyvinyltransferase [Nitrospirota bacterium]
MDKIEIEGGISLTGEVSISGAKNAALPVMAASILSSGENLIYNVPRLRDISTFGKLLAYLGMGYHQENGEVILDSTNISSIEAPYDFVKTMRASVLVLGPLLARTGEAKVSLPGGCAIGARPINLHIMGLEKMGAEITLTEGYIHAKAKRLKGAVVYFDMPTVTGTENLMMAGTLADGETVLENAACEPEVVDLANALISMGANIRGAGTSIVRINGVSSLRPLDYRIIPDRIETGTFLAGAAITGGDVRINNCSTEHVEAIINKLRETGTVITFKGDTLHVKGPDKLVAEDIKTMPYPGFPTDMQAQFMALMTLAEGTSLITENIFENRFMHVAELRRMGADIRVEGSIAKVKGVKSLKGAPVMATDLRASASLVVAGLAAQGTTIIDRVYHIDRGYQGIEEKLKLLGAKIRRVKG